MGARDAARWLPFALGAGALLMALPPRQKVAPRPLGPTDVNRDLGLLVPAFRARIEVLIERMQARGFDAMVWETVRSFERAAMLQKRGTGGYSGPDKPGMHALGLAVDIISRSKKWDAPAAFWTALGEEVARLGLTWGGHWTRVDKPHVQAVPVDRQAYVRKLAPEQRAIYVSNRLAQGVPTSSKVV